MDSDDQKLQRSFHMNYNEKLTQILTDFPRLDDIHPFYADLVNVLYDRDHYKLALGQMNIARQVRTAARDQPASRHTHPWAPGELSAERVRGVRVRSSLTAWGATT